jgi:hypothetical protein
MAWPTGYHGQRCTIKLVSLHSYLRGLPGAGEVSPGLPRSSRAGPFTHPCGPFFSTPALTAMRLETIRGAMGMSAPDPSSRLP